MQVPWSLGVSGGTCGGDTTPEAAQDSAERPEVKRALQGVLVIRKAVWEKGKSCWTEQLPSRLLTSSARLTCNRGRMMPPLAPVWKCRPPVHNKLWTYILPLETCSQVLESQLSLFCMAWSMWIFPGWGGCCEILQSLRRITKPLVKSFP